MDKGLENYFPISSRVKEDSITKSYGVSKMKLKKKKKTLHRIALFSP